MKVLDNTPLGLGYSMEDRVIDGQFLRFYAMI